MKYCVSVLLAVIICCSSACADETNGLAAGHQNLEIALSLNMDSPSYTTENDSRSKDVFSLLKQAHIACGLNAYGFEEAINRLQTVSLDTDFERLISIYGTAARLCHDAKIKPTKYCMAESADTSTVTGKMAVPSLDITMSPKNVLISGKFPLTKNESVRKQKSLVTEIEYSDKCSIPADKLNQLQALEDLVYCQVIRVLHAGNFSEYRFSDIPGTWQWDCPGVGTITFDLKPDRKMTGTLTIPCNDPKYLIGNYCEGYWSFCNGRLEIKMLKGGNKSLKWLLKKQEQQWLIGRVLYLSDKEMILDANNKLVKITTGN